MARQPSKRSSIQNLSYRPYRPRSHASLAELDDTVSLDSRAAENILLARAQQPFLSIAELWAVPVVKTRALGKSYAHLFATSPAP